MSSPASIVPQAELKLKPSATARRLTVAEREQYRELGYLKSLPAIDCASIDALQRRFHELAALLPDDIDINRINMWHKANACVHRLCTTPAILDYVEDLIGPNFYQWGGQFFVKYPGDGSEVPWHQDSQYWPLSPCTTVSVWLAIYDVDEGNGAMKVVRGSHRAGNFAHHEVDDPRFVLEQEVDAGSYDPADVVTLDLKAGEVSIHDAGLLHGSLPNQSERIRAGFVMRYSPTQVKCDLSVWPTFETTLVRGIDVHKHNPIAKVPTSNGFPTAKFQPASDFV